MALVIVIGLGDNGCGSMSLYEIDHCTAFRPCNTHHMTPTSLSLDEIGW